MKILIETLDYLKKETLDYENKVLKWKDCTFSFSCIF